MRAVVWTGEVEVRDDVDVGAVGAREVRVRVHRAGLCHSDVSVIEGTIPMPAPCVLGHEAAGVVEEVGSAVTAVAPGDHVVLTTLGNCGQCDACDRGEPTQCRSAIGGGQHRFTLAGGPAFQFANTGAFAEWTVVHESQAIRIDRRVPFDAACLIGCAVITGAGAVFNRARVEPGRSVAVIGAGGIGLSVVQAARLAAADRIVVIDTNPAKETIARTCGATDFIDPRTAGDVVAAVRDLAGPGGVDYSFECVGRPELIRQAIDMLDWGGSCVLLGVPGPTVEASFVVSGMYHNKSILGCRYGAARPHHDIPMLARMYLDGRLLLDELVSKVYDLSLVRTAVEDLAAGQLNRGVLSVTG